MLPTISAIMFLIIVAAVVRRQVPSAHFIAVFKTHRKDIILTLTVIGICFSIFMSIVFFDTRQIQNENQSIYDYYGELEIKEIRVGGANNHFDRVVIFANEEKKYVNLKCNDGCDIIEIE